MTSTETKITDFYFSRVRIALNLILSLILSTVFTWYIFGSGNFGYNPVWLQISFVIIWMITLVGIFDFGQKLFRKSPFLEIFSDRLIIHSSFISPRVILLSDLKDVTPFRMKPLANYFQRDQILLEFKSGSNEYLDIENLNSKKEIYPLIDKLLHPHHV